MTFPITPVAKGRPRFTRQGHAYTPKKTEMFEKALRLEARSEMAERGLSIFKNALTIDLIFCLPKPKSAKRERPTTRPDLDNYIKGVLDALNGITWEDDSQIVELTACKQYGGQQIILTIEEVE